MSQEPKIGDKVLVSEYPGAIFEITDDMTLRGETIFWINSNQLNKTFWCNPSYFNVIQKPSKVYEDYEELFV